MSDREKIISGLQYTIEMFLFDPATGHSKDPDDLNNADRITYDACIGAIALLKAQETKTGYWITEEPNTYTRRTYCSVCSKSAPFIYISDDYYGGRSHGETKKTKYCPNCGTKME